MVLIVQKCVACGKFMNCQEIDARHEFVPDTPFGPEVSRWTCGPCVRAEQESPNAD